MKANLTKIEAFLENKTVALIGASRNEKKFGTQLLKHLWTEGFNVIPVHHEAAEIQGIHCFRSIIELPDEVKAICLVTHKKDTDRFVNEAIAHGIKHIWVQQQSETEQTILKVKSDDVNIVLGRCLFMYSNPKGFHKFHQRLNRIFGSIAS
jgi:predicted CoA-binding protein